MNDELKQHYINLPEWKQICLDKNSELECLVHKAFTSYDGICGKIECPLSKEIVLESIKSHLSDCKLKNFENPLFKKLVELADNKTIYLNEWQYNFCQSNLKKFDFTEKQDKSIQSILTKCKSFYKVDLWSLYNG